MEDLPRELLALEIGSVDEVACVSTDAPLGPVEVLAGHCSEIRVLDDLVLSILPVEFLLVVGLPNAADFLAEGRELRLGHVLQRDEGSRSNAVVRNFHMVGPDAYDFLRNLFFLLSRKISGSADRFILLLENVHEAVQVPPLLVELRQVLQILNGAIPVPRSVSGELLKGVHRRAQLQGLIAVRIALSLGLSVPLLRSLSQVLLVEDER
mmetsp:Transcript_10911/g.16565  ORF Transcript_10911/g.16565 Transcript_10911/m.16565 type:complete len:209 (-) Transcript_10911:623-1249(-)